MSYYRYSEPKIGRMNQLKITQKTSAGVVLDGDILLPTKSIPRSIPANIGDILEVFVYINAQGKLTATTQKPFTEVGKFADLQVVEISDYGIFLDWGLPKDLMLPYNEEVGTLAIEDFAIVYTYMDDRSQRITATMKYDKY
ncbi:MAG: S1-like domain-containing RNA-binding protein, partial [Wohlfahrtiimonas sp.]